MWPFERSRSNEELWEELTKLKRLVESRDLDWADMRARCKRLLDRTEKAAAALTNPEPVEESTEPLTSNGGGIADLVHHALTPRQRTIQAQILKQRMGRT
jgi:hypothetical protein